jgi:hypothetical protein
MADLFSPFPTSPEGIAVNFRINTPTQVSETFSGKIRRVGLGVSFYSWEMTYQNLTPLQAGSITGFVSQALGQQFSFRIVLPRISTSKAPNQTPNTPRLSANLAVGSTSCQLTNCGATRNVLAAGDFFKFDNHSKVYMCVSPCVSNSSGNATLFFSGPAVQSATTNTNLTIRAVPFTAILDEEAQEFEVGIGGITNLSLAMREVW